MASPTTITFQSIPLEVLPAIFSYACTDEGHTGCTIGLVCKAFRAVCLDTGVDIQCALVGGKTKMEAFLNMMQKREKAKRRVEALLLAYRHSDWTAREQGQSINQRGREDWQNVVDLMFEILRSISPSHLRILHVYFPRYLASPIPFIPALLPSLSELSIAGMYTIRPEYNLYRSPALKRLYLGPNLRVEEGSNFGHTLKTFCPQITHLRVRATAPGDPEPYVTDNILRFVYAFCQSAKPQFAENINLDAQANDHGSVAVGEHSIPEALHRIIVEFYPLFIPGNAFVSHETTRDRRDDVSAYRTLASEARQSGRLEEQDSEGQRRSLLVCSCPPDIRSTGERQYIRDEYMTAKQQWLERCGGTGAGCWV